MKLLDYLIKKDIATERFAIDLEIPIATMFKYVSGKIIPSEKRAQLLQDATGGIVTVKDLRGEWTGKERRGGYRGRKKRA